MIVGSIVLVIGALVLLVVGWLQADDTLFYSSIVASVLAAFALLIGVRQFPAGRVPEADFDVRSGGARLAPWPSPTGRAGVPRQSRPGVGDVAFTTAPVAGQRGLGRTMVEPASGVVTPNVGGPEIEDGADLIADQARLPDDGVPADEPDEQPTTLREAAAVGHLGAEVVVVNGRPRYHVDGCLHLLGRDCDRLPVREAIVLGFSPCASCEPVAHLIGG